jgi:aryl-alcohol dehydrogenase-like predicted oxidoreductase
MRLTGNGVWGEPENPAECIAILRRAVDLGINFVDTADSYGPFVSEWLIAQALHPYPKGVVIATKAGLQRPGPDEWELAGQRRPQSRLRVIQRSISRTRGL